MSEQPALIQLQGGKQNGNGFCSFPTRRASWILETTAYAKLDG